MYNAGFDDGYRDAMADAVNGNAGAYIGSIEDEYSAGYHDGYDAGQADKEHAE